MSRKLICPTESPRHQNLEAAGKVKIKYKTEKRVCIEAKHSPAVSSPGSCYCLDMECSPEVLVLNEGSVMEL